MRDLQPMYEGFPFSPPTRITEPINATSTSITVEDPDTLPDAPNKASLGINYNGETIRYATKVGNTLGGVTRGVDAKNGYGEARDWSAGTTIARYFTNADQSAIEDNIRTVQENVGAVDAALTGLVTLAEPRTITVPIADLRQTILSLPRLLSGDVTINVLPGTTEDQVDIIGFYGPGHLIVQAEENSSDAFLSHTVSLFNMRNCSNPQIRLGRFTCSVATSSSLQVVGVTAEVQLSHIRAAAGVNTSTANIGIYTWFASNVQVDRCLFANKHIAVFARGASNIRARELLAGSANMVTLFRAIFGSTIILESDDQPTPAANIATTFASTASGGRIIGPRGEPFRWQAGPTGITYTVPITELRQFVFQRLPKYLQQNVTVNVLPGTTTDLINISFFEGPGTLTIRAVDGNNAPVRINNSTTHNVGQYYIIDCKNSRIDVEGFRCTSSYAWSRIRVERCTALVALRFIHINNPSNSVGVFITEANAFLYASTISHQENAMRANSGAILRIGYTAGVNNGTVFTASNGGFIFLSSGFAASGTNRSHIWSGGIIQGPNSGTELLVPARDNAIDIGTAGTRFRTLFATTGTINTSDANDKENVSDLPECFQDFFMKLRPVTFNYKDGDGFEDGQHTGLIAQEVLEALQQCEMTSLQFGGLVKSVLEEERETGEFEEVETGEVRMELSPVQPTDLILDEYGNVDSESEAQPNYIEVPVVERVPVMEKVRTGERFGLRYSEFIPILIGMVQEQQRRIEELESRVR